MTKKVLITGGAGFIGSHLADNLIEKGGYDITIFDNLSEQEALNLIQEGLEWLGVNYTEILYKSDRLELFYEYCEKLIEDHIAYVCFCSGDDFREKYKKLGKNCPHRSHSIEKNKQEWVIQIERTSNV